MSAFATLPYSPRSRTPDLLRLLIIGSCLCGAGCLPPPAAPAPAAPAPVEPLSERPSAGSPASRVQIKPAGLVEPRRTQQLIDRLRSELARNEPEPDPTWLSTEQVTAMAIGEINAGNEWDAALLLSIASYRSSQEARSLSGSMGFNYELRRKEIRVLENTDPMRGLAKLSDDLLRGEAPPAVADELQQIDNTGFNLGLTVAELDAKRNGGSAEQLQNPELADAFLARLLRDIKQGNSSVRVYLSVTPLEKFRRAALNELTVLSPQLEQLTKPQALRLHDDFIAALSSPRAGTRMNGAYLLGVTGQSTDAKALRAQLATESAPEVQLVLRHALLLLGQPGQMPPLPASCRGPACATALMLTRLTPVALKKELDAQTLVAYAKDEQAPRAARDSAVAYLARMAAEQVLPDEAITLLLTSCNAANESEACQGVAFSQQLTRERVSHLVLELPGSRAALFYRWGDVVDPIDLNVLREHYALAAKDPQRSAELDPIVRAVSHLPGLEAASTLEDWYVTTDSATTLAFIATNWSKRPEATPERREALLAKADDARRLVLLVCIDAARALKLGLAPKDGSSINAHSVALLLAGALSRSNLEPALWPLTSYQNPKLYPYDVLLRRSALHALLLISLQRARASAPPTQPVSPLRHPTAH